MSRPNDPIFPKAFWDSKMLNRISIDSLGRQILKLKT
jgi:hypothetical protein